MSGPGRVCTVTSYDAATNRATVDVFGASVAGVLNVTGEHLRPNWVVYVEERGGAHHADWVVTDIYNPDLNLRREFESADVDTAGTTTSLTYVASLTTGGAGPTITDIWLHAGKRYALIVSAIISNSLGAGHESVMTPVVSGASSLAADDGNAARTQDATPAVVEKTTVFTPTGSGLHTVTCNYKVVNASTGSFSFRRLTVMSGRS